MPPDLNEGLCEQHPDIMGGMKPYFDPNAEKSAWFTHGYAAD